jgi:hypothetical protein
MLRYKYGTALRKGARACTHLQPVSLLSWAFRPLRPLAGGEGGAHRASDGRVRWVAPFFGTPAPPTSPLHSPPPRAERENPAGHVRPIMPKCVHALARKRGARATPAFAGMTSIKRNKNQPRRSLRPHLLGGRERAEVERCVLFDALAARQLRGVPAAAQCLD